MKIMTIAEDRRRPEGGINTQENSMIEEKTTDKIEGISSRKEVVMMTKMIERI